MRAQSTKGRDPAQRRARAASPTRHGCHLQAQRHCQWMLLRRCQSQARQLHQARHFHHHHRRRHCHCRRHPPPLPQCLRRWRCWLPPRHWQTRAHWHRQWTTRLAEICPATQCQHSQPITRGACQTTILLSPPPQQQGPWDWASRVKAEGGRAWWSSMREGGSRGWGIREGGSHTHPDAPGTGAPRTSRKGVGVVPLCRGPLRPEPFAGQHTTATLWTRTHVSTPQGQRAGTLWDSKGGGVCGGWRDWKRGHPAPIKGMVGDQPNGGTHARRSQSHSPSFTLTRGTMGLGIGRQPVQTTGLGRWLGPGRGALPVQCEVPLRGGSVECGVG